MNFKRINLALLSIAIATSTLAQNRPQLAFEEYFVILLTNSQVFKIMEDERKEFITNDRPYTLDEVTNYHCNAIIVAEENIKFANQYPEYKNREVIQKYIKKHGDVIKELQQILVKNNRKCKGYLVRLPTTSKGKTPLFMDQSSANKSYSDYYAKREQINQKYQLAQDTDSKRKIICELKNLSVTTEMNILLYPSMVKSPEGKKVLATISADQEAMRTKLSMDEKCGF